MERPLNDSQTELCVLLVRKTHGKNEMGKEIEEW